MSAIINGFQGDQMSLLNYVGKFFRDPVGFIKRTVFKLIIGPLKYGNETGYNAAEYWENRFSKFGDNIQGPGDESISEEDNRKMYEEAAVAFDKILEDEKIDLANSRVLEIGLGNGFYTDILHKKGVKSYTGVDITDVLFDGYRQKYDGFEFIKCDITTEKIEGEFDFIMLIDVSQHIVEEVKIKAALEMIKGCMAEKAVFLITPLGEETKKLLFYVHHWSPEFVKSMFGGFSFSPLTTFRLGKALVVRKP